MSELQKLPNIGKVLSEKFEMVGIRNEQELKAVGTEKAFLLIRSIDNDACIHQLFAIDGAVQGIRWHNLSKTRKDELKTFFNLK
jgi:DNA transformation protein